WATYEMLRAASDTARRVRFAVAWCLPIGVAITVVALYNAARFGSAVEGGYGEEAFAFTTPLAVGVSGFLLSPGKSVFAYAPIAVAGVFVGWPLLGRRHAAAAWCAAAATVVHLVFFARYYVWYGGGVWGPRFLVVVLPFML